MELGHESKRIKKLRTDAKKILNDREKIMLRAEKAEADKEQETL